MGRVDVEIAAADGRSNGTLHLSDGDGPWPGVLVFPDAGGVRETLRERPSRAWRGRPPAPLCRQVISMLMA